MRFFLALILCSLVTAATAQVWEDQKRFGSKTAVQTLRVVSSTDTALFAPILETFVAENDDVAVEYFVAGSSDIDRVFRADPQGFDVVISSAMDLQFKLVNDGLGQALGTVEYPDWAQWRRSLFAFTSEPAAIVVNKAAFKGVDIPQTRQALIRFLRENVTDFQGRLGTYDVRQSGLGYLFATQDARTSETYWRLMEVMGSLETKLYCCSGEMIEDVATGHIYVAYNVLGSYAQARKDLADQIEIILPSDFQTIMMRTAFVSANSKSPDLAEAFMQHLLMRGAAPDDRPFLPLLDLGGDARGQSTIPLEPALLTYLDTLKNRRFLREWSNAVIQ